MSLMSLDKALESGDIAAALTSGAQTIGFGASAYTAFTGESTAIGDFLNGSPIYDGLDGNEAVGQEVPGLSYIGMVNDLVHGNYVGLAVDVAAYFVPVVGWVYGIYNLVTGLFGGDDIPDPWGTGRFVWDGNGISYYSEGETGGKEAVANFMQNTLAGMNAIISEAHRVNPGSALGIIPNRMSSVGYGMDGFRFVDIDSLTGVQKNPGLRYDTSGKPYNAPVGSAESFQSMGEAYIRSALAREAIAPLWEVRTAAIQTQYGDPEAGLREEERAGMEGQLAAPPSGDSQIFRPVVLDLNGDGIHTVDKDHSGVAFNIDDSGYLKNTGWIGSDDAFLTLDRNYNDHIDSGKEMFSNSQVALGKRGLEGLKWVDSNYDNKLDAADPVFSELSIWRDANSNGEIESGEQTTLAQNGITSLNFAMGTFDQNGQAKQMASPDLVADTEGTRVTTIPQGILIETSNGQTSLLVNRVDDLTLVEANRDGLHGLEDIELIVSAADLLANDTFGGFHAQNLSLSSIQNVRHGTAFVDANQFVHFRPEANYNGTGAGFDYTVEGINGQLGTATADIELQNVNDAPTIVAVNHTPRPIFGYDYGSVESDGEPLPFYTQYREPLPIYTPYDTVSYDDYGNASVIHHDIPISYDDGGAGNIVAIDSDDPAEALQYTIVGQPQFGSVAIDSNTGQFQYTSWLMPNVPTSSSCWQYYPGEYHSTDSFLVQVTDPHGAYTTQVVNVAHYGPYVPPTPPGGDDGCFPVIADLDHNGFSFTPVQDSNIFFDINGDGWKRKVSWVGPGDGVLAYDANSNGKVDNGTEIAFARYVPGAQSDLEGLKAFDSNGDGVLSKLDEKWGKFGIWQDANQNGVTDSDEFKSLDQLGIDSISLTSDRQFSVVDGNTIQGIAPITMTDGSIMNAADAIMAYSNDVQIPQSDGTTSTVSSSPFSPSGTEIDGTDGNDLLLGLTGNTVIKTGEGNDVVFSGDGNDLIQSGNGNSVIYAAGGNDIVTTGSGDNVVYGGLGNDLIIGGNGNNALFGEGGNDVVFSSGGNDLIDGGAGNDVLYAGGGDDTVSGGSGNDALFGADGDDVLTGGSGYDRLDGGAGKDLLDGGTDSDDMIGGAGDDIYVVDNAGDTVLENPGEGIDTVRSDISYALGANLENLTLTGTNTIEGSGNELDNVLIGNSADNILMGGAGNDMLNGGAGSDTLVGGTGDDLFIVDNAADTVIENTGEGDDTVKSSVTYGLDANVENLILTGSSAINGVGNELDNHLSGNAADNVLDGGAGADVMAAGKGNDVYIVDNAGDQVSEAVDEGMDLVRSSIDYTLGANFENLSLTGTATQGIGNALDNVIHANDLGNTLAGEAGRDTLMGGVGSDILDGGADADAMAGGSGNDIYVVDNAGDMVTELADAGVDTVIASVNYELSDNVENLTLADTADLNAFGNTLDNVIIGNIGNNVLDGSFGADTMIGSEGSDTYIVDNAGDTVIEHANEGADTVLASVDYTLTANVENLTLTGAATYGAGNDLDNAINGNGLGNTLMGAAGNDALNGSIGNDILDGGVGADAMTGGAGNDIYVVDNLGDRVTEQANEGADTVQSSIDYTLGANLENLTLTGSAVYGAGNDLDNALTANDLGNVLAGEAGNDVLSGGAGNDVLDGGTGADIMAGHRGDDFYIVDDANDVVAEAENEGNDTVQSGVNYTLTANVENLTLVGSATEGAGNELDNIINANDLGNRLSGGAGNDVLNGGASNDSLNGGTGSDAMKGGLGDDLYAVDDAGDQVIEGLGEGIDSVKASIDYVLTANVENLSLTGLATHATGNELDNVIIANDLGNVLLGAAGNDILEGGAGNDVLDGGTGADAMTGGNGDDTYVVDDIGDQVLETLFGGNDTVLSSITYVLPGQVENLTLTGSVDLNGTGNELNNVILGNAGNNILDGAAGTDTMAGNAGNDTYIVDHAGDLVIEQADEGADTVEAEIDYTLTANVEKLILTGVSDINGTGNELANVIIGNAGNNILDGGVNADTMLGGGGNDIYIVDNAGDTVIENVNEGDDTVEAGVSYSLSANVENLILTGAANINGTGNELDNRIVGNSGDNVLVGGKGNDVLEGGSGNDTYLYNLNDGLDAIIDVSGNDALSFGPGLTLDNVSLRVSSVNGTLTAHLRALDACGCEQQDQGLDFVISVDGSGRYVSPIENFVFADGSVKTFDDVLIKAQTTTGTAKTTSIITGRNDDTIYSGPGINTIYAGTGNDIVYAGARGDTAYGEGGDDYLRGDVGNDILDGGCGNDILDGKIGDDTLRSGEDNSGLLGGNGRDSLLAGGGSDFIAGGQHDDTLSTGAGKNVVAFNRGDQQDIILASQGAENTLSLGGGIAYADLAFSKNGNDLVLSAGSHDSLTFKDWYANTANRSFVTLQMIEAASSDYKPGTSDLLRNQQVESFDFLKLADKFDQDRLANVSLSSWSLMNGLLDVHQIGSDNTALGGDVAYYYGMQGSLSGMNVTAAQDVLKDEKFGSSAQQIHQWAGISNGAVKL